MLPTTQLSLWSVCHHSLSYSTDQGLLSLSTSRSHSPRAHLPVVKCDTGKVIMSYFLQNSSVGIMKWLLILSLFSVKNKWHCSNQRNCLWAVNPCFLCIIDFVSLTLQPQKPQNLCQVLLDAAISPATSKAFYTVPQNPPSCPMSPELTPHIHPPKTSLLYLAWPWAEDQTIQAAVNVCAGLATLLSHRWCKYLLPLPSQWFP